MTEQFTFSTEALKIISYIADTIEDSDPAGIIDSDHMVDILKFTTPKGEYVLNRHSAAQEVWLASPVSGPYHFYYENGYWVSKNGTKLLEVLNKELSQFINIQL